jgi:conjugal transfer/entry exclusion protein
MAETINSFFAPFANTGEYESQMMFPLSVSQNDADVNAMFELRKELYDKGYYDTIDGRKDDKQAVDKYNAEYADILDSLSTAKKVYNAQCHAFLNSCRTLMTISKVQEELSEVQRSISSLGTTLSTHVEALTNIGASNIDMSTFDSFNQYLTSLDGSLHRWKATEYTNREESESRLRALSPLFSTIENFTGYRACPICLQNEVAIYLTPCGHTLCKTCLTKIKGECYMCRKRIISHKQLYYS